MFDGKDFSTKNAPLSAQPFTHKKTTSDDEEEGASTSGASNLKSFEDVEKLPPQSVVPSLKAKIVNLSPKKPVRQGASYMRIAGLQGPNSIENNIILRSNFYLLLIFLNLVGVGSLNSKLKPIFKPKLKFEGEILLLNPPQDVQGKRNAVNLFGETGDKVEAGKVTAFLN